jgi:trigger factor
LPRGEFGLAETKTLLNVTQKKLPASQVGLTIEVPTDLSQKTYDQVVNDFVRNADIPGFRRGKVPRQVVLQRIGQARLKAAAVEAIVQKSLEQAIRQENIQALGNFQLQTDFDELIAQYQPGTPLSFSAAVDVPPEAQLGNYKGFQVKAVQVDYDPAKVDQVLLEQQTQRATLIPVEDRPAQSGDTVLIDFKGHLAPGSEGNAEAEAIVGGDATDFQLDLVPGQFIPGFIEGVIAMKIGETREVDVSFPEDYFQADLAGKAATFSIILNEIKEKELPALDDDFADEISEFSTMAELREFLEKRYRQEAEQQTEGNINNAILEELLQVTEAELPDIMVREETNAMLTQSLMRLQNQGIDLNRLLTEDLVERMREQSRPEALLRLKRSLALAEVSKSEKIDAPPAEIEERFQAALEQMSGQKIDHAKLREIIEGELIETKTLAWLREQSQVTFISAAEAEALQKAKELSLETASEEETKSKADQAKSSKPKADAAETAEPEPDTAAEATSKITRKTTAKKTAEPKDKPEEAKPVAEATSSPEAKPDKAAAKKTAARKTTTKKPAASEPDA